MPRFRTASQTLEANATAPKAATPEPAPPEAKAVQEWEFKIRGRGTSGWMSYVKEAGGEWVPLRLSDTSFISAVAAIEPEVLRLAFPHTQVKP